MNAKAFRFLVVAGVVGVALAAPLHFADVPRLSLGMGLAVFLTLYFLLPFIFDMRGALIAFFLPVLGLFLFGFYNYLGDPHAGNISGWETAGNLLSGAFGGPFLFVLLLWLVGVPFVALGIWINRAIQKTQ